MLDVLVIGFFPILLPLIGASRIVTQGLKQSAQNDSGETAVLTIQSMSISNFGTLLATTTSLAAATQKASAGFDATFPSTDASANPICTYQATFGTATGTIVISNICVHRVASGTFTNLHGGVDGLSITKDNTYTLIPKLQITYSTQ